MLGTTKDACPFAAVVLEELIKPVSIRFWGAFERLFVPVLLTPPKLWMQSFR